MGGLDYVLSDVLESTIRRILGNEIERIDERLKDKWGISLSQAVTEFDKLDYILREFFGNGAYGIEQKIMDQICKVEHNQYGIWRITITNSNIVKTILSTFTSERQDILDTVNKEGRIIRDIIKISKMPTTSCYRNINKLLYDGYLVPNGYEFGSDGRRIKKYRAFFESFGCSIKNNKKTVQFDLRELSTNTSTFLKVVLLHR